MSTSLTRTGLSPVHLPDWRSRDSQARIVARPAVAASARQVIAGFGDSIMRRNYDDSAYTFPRVTNQGPLYWALALSGARMRQGRSKGISGATSTDILANALPVVLSTANNPRLDYVLSHMGANDLANLKTAAQVDAAVRTLVANTAEACRQIVAAKAQPIIGAVLRRTDAAAVPKQSMFDAAWINANYLLNELADANGYHWWNGNRYWVDATDAIIAGNSGEGVHPLIKGAYALGRPLSGLISELAPPVDFTAHGYLSELTGNPLLSVSGGGNALGNSSQVTYTGGAASVIPSGFSMGDLGANNTAIATVSRDGDGALTVSITGGGIVLEKSFNAVAGQVFEVASAFDITGGGNGLFSVTTDIVNSVQSQLSVTGVQETGITNVYYPDTASCRDSTHQIAVIANATYKARVLIRSNGSGTPAVVKLSELNLFRVS